MTAQRDCPTRPALARRLIARGVPLPGHLLGQLGAAGAEARQFHDRMAGVLPLIEPSRDWWHRVDAAPSEAVRAHLLAAILDCTTICIHLRKGGPQPAFAALALRRIDCGRCSQTLRRPPPDESDRCDACAQRARDVRP